MSSYAMTGWIAAAVFVLATLPAPAQTRQLFPIGQSFRVMSISGYDVQNKGLSMTISHTGGDYRSAGQAGCNTWSSTVVLRDTVIDFIDISTTKKACGKAEMTTADAFLTSLRQAKRWRLERADLIIEGDTAELRLKPGLAKFKPDKAPAKKKAH